jgi:hypothetical protein
MNEVLYNILFAIYAGEKKYFNYIYSICKEAE